MDWHKKTTLGLLDWFNSPAYPTPLKGPIKLVQLVPKFQTDQNLAEILMKIMDRLKIKKYHGSKKKRKKLGVMPPPQSPPHTVSRLRHKWRVYGVFSTMPFYVLWKNLGKQGIKSSTSICGALVQNVAWVESSEEHGMLWTKKSLMVSDLSWLSQRDQMPMPQI